MIIDGKDKGKGLMESGEQEREQDEGQREKMRREEDQSSSGLWALSQLVPRMIS